MNPHTSQKEVQHFIGEINYNRNIRPMRLHTLLTLTILTYIKKKFK